jgi:hypothetical protein
MHLAAPCRYVPVNFNVETVQKPAARRRAVIEVRV